MVEKEECYFFECVGGIHEDTPSFVFIQIQFSSNLNIENVHLQALNMSNVDVSQLTVQKHKLQLGDLKVMCLYVGEILLSMMDYMWSW